MFTIKRLGLAPGRNLPHCTENIRLQATYEEYSSPLIQACLACNTEKVHSVLESGFNLNTERDGRGRTAMHISAIRGTLEMLESLRRYTVQISRYQTIWSTELPQNCVM